MSRPSLTLRRPNDDIARQAEEDQRDNDALNALTRKRRDHIATASSLGLVLGLLLATSLRWGRLRLFEAVRAKERPIAVVLGDGRAERIPDLAPLIKASKLGGVATYGLCGFGGSLVGTALGWLVGNAEISMMGMRKDEEGQRMARALSRYWADVARKEEGR